MLSILTTTKLLINNSKRGASPYITHTITIVVSFDSSKCACSTFYDSREIIKIDNTFFEYNNKSCIVSISKYLNIILLSCIADIVMTKRV